MLKKIFEYLYITLSLTISLTIAKNIGHQFTCGKLYYRTLFLDDNNGNLYVGAMDKVFRLDPTNITKSDCDKDALKLPASNVVNCVSRGKREDYDCRNHIRVIWPIEGGSRVYICGTNAHSPKDFVVYANLTHLARHEFFPGVGDGIAKCPFDPEDNSTAVWVEEGNGNPGGHPAIYSGTNAEFTKADSVIFRGDIFDPKTGRREYNFKRTIKYDSHMLDKPDFVGSFEVGPYVYFVFRELAVEYINCGKAVYSRIARVCKNDVGGKNILNQNWATYVKARLNCSIPGEFPFFFNEIQDIFKSPSDDKVFHGVFTTSSNGLSGSAICSFQLQDVEQAFEGKFKEQSTSTSIWLPVQSDKVPVPRPGTCVNDTRDLNDNVLNFIRKHSLMDADISEDSEGPSYFQRDVTFTKITVDDDVRGESFGQEITFTVIFAGTVDGKVYKVVRWFDQDEKRYKSHLADVFSVTYPNPIRRMVFSQKEKTLFVSSDYEVKQIKVESLCSNRYGGCFQCSRDPYCGWDREEGLCRPKHYTLLQDPTGRSRGLCDQSTPVVRVYANYGQAVHLSCGIKDEQVRGEHVVWRHSDGRGNRRPILFDDNKYVLTQDHGLVILGVNEKDSGRLHCYVGKNPITEYDLSIDTHRCAAPERTTDYQKAYSEWCHQFQKYRNALKTWEKKRNECSAIEGMMGINTNSVYNTSPLI